MSQSTDKSNTKPSRQVAVALQYDEENDPAPAVVAKGEGLIAQKILEVAQQHNIPIRQNEGLANALGRLNLGDYIPEQLFPAVAEILAFLYRMNKLHSGGPRP